MSAEPAVVDRTLAAIADPCRRRAVELLGDGPRRAGELAAALDVAPSVMSRHLQVLRESGLVEEAHPRSTPGCASTRCGRAMADLKSWLAAVVPI